MRLVIDGRRLTARRTGVGRCLESLLADWSLTGWPLEEVLLVVSDPEGLARVPDGGDLRTRVIGQKWPGLVWETLGLGRLLGRDDLLFAPANLVPMNWRGPTRSISHPEGAINQVWQAMKIEKAHWTSDSFQCWSACAAIMGLTNRVQAY